MLAPRKFTAVRVLSALAMLTVTGCNRDDLAPDCFKIDADTNECLIPDPGGTAPGINCELFPDGAVGAEYSFTPAVGGGSGNFTQWAAVGLPDGLSIDPNTGEISGVPTSAMTYSGITLSMFDAGKGEGFDATCGDMLINEALNANLVAMEANHCLDASASMEDMLALLEGGDGTEITCSATANNASSATCPLGDGNGRMAPGLSFNESSCTHSGSISGDRRGTWVWMVEITQSGYTTAVPFCATNDFDSFHDITLTADGAAASDLEPALYDFDPNAELSFGGGTHQWAIDDPACPGTDCNTYGFRFNVTCSPFDVTAPYQVTLSPSAGSATGLTHEMTATGPSIDPKFDGRPWVASFEMSYCTSGVAGTWDTDNADQFEQNAQTRYHYDVVAYPSP